MVCVCVCVCVCVLSSHSFWTSSSLDVPAGVTHRRKVTQDFGAMTLLSSIITILPVSSQYVLLYIVLVGLFLVVVCMVYMYVWSRI